MWDQAARLFFALAYAGVSVCALWHVSDTENLGRRFALTAVGLVGILWSVFYQLAIFLVAIQAEQWIAMLPWFSRVAHLPTVLGLGFMVYLIWDQNRMRVREEEAIE